MDHLHSPQTDRLFRAILRLNDVDECYRFFEDLCTIKEIKDMTQRLDVARLLSQGLNYQEVAEGANVSTATISRVKRCLEYGSGGYELALEGMKEEEEHDN